MARGTGTDFICGLTKGAAWGTWVDGDAANARFRPLKFDWNDNIEEITDESYNQSSVRKESSQAGRYRFSCTYSVDMKYQGLELHTALLMGASSISGSGPYMHTQSPPVATAPAGSRTGIYGSLTFDDRITQHNVQSVKCTSATFTGTQGGRLLGEFTLMGNKRVEVASSAMDSATENAAIDHIQLIADVTDDNYQIAPQASGSLANIDINGWSVTFDFPVDDDDRIFTSATSPYPAEPMSQRLTTTGSLTIPHEAITYLTTGIQAASTFRLHLDHIVTAVTKTWGIALPSLTFTSGTANPTDMGGIPQVLNFRCDEADATPSGFDLAVPYILNYNLTAASPLA